MLHAAPDSGPPSPPSDPAAALAQLLGEGITWGDALEWLEAIPPQSVDMFFTSPPYADMRAYSRIHPDRYVDWFLPFAQAMLEATKETGSFVLNIHQGRAVRGRRHTYVYQLVPALEHVGWNLIDTHVWHKPNAIPGRFGPRTKDSWEFVFRFGKTTKPHFDLDAVRVPYKTQPSEIERRRLDQSARRNTAAGHGRKRAQTYEKGGADPGNVITAAQSYNQHYGVAHTAAMPEELAEWFVKTCTRPREIILDPFAGSATTTVVAWRLGRRAGGVELHREFADEARARLETQQPIQGIAAWR